MKKNKWKQAEKNFNSAVSAANNGDDLENIEAASFLMLGLGCFIKNEIETALNFTNSGLKAYNERGERKHIKFQLLRNKAVYLERLGKINEGLVHIQEVWPLLNAVEDSETKLTFYSVRADLLRMAGFIDEAIQYAQEGAELARINKHYQCFFDIWTILGSLYTIKKDPTKANECFEAAFSARSNLKNLVPLTDAFIWQAKLFADQQDWEQAINCASQAIKNSKQTNDASKLVISIKIMGDLHKSSGKNEEAIWYYDEAFRISKKYNYEKIAGTLVSLKQRTELMALVEGDDGYFSLMSDNILLKKVLTPLSIKI